MSQTTLNVLLAWPCPLLVLVSYEEVTIIPILQRGKLRRKEANWLFKVADCSVSLTSGPLNCPRHATHLQVFLAQVLPALSLEVASPLFPTAGFSSLLSSLFLIRHQNLCLLF